VTVVGAGGIGSAVAALLAKAGHEVTLVFKIQEDAAKVRKGGLRLKGAVSFETQVNVLEWPSPLPSADLLIVGVKTYDTGVALAGARGSRFDAVVSAQNGLQKEETIAKLLGRNDITGAIIQITATNRGGGEILVSDIWPSFIGDIKGGISGPVRKLAETFTSAGIPTELTDSIRSVEWTKTSQWIATSVLSVITGYAYPLVFSTPWLTPLFVEIVRECAAVAKADGAEIIDVPNVFVETLLKKSGPEACTWLEEKAAAFDQNWRNYRAAMLLDVEGGRQTEFQDVIGYVCSKASRAGIATPALDFVVRLVNHIIRSHHSLAKQQ
jgi:2-dehydropantoate 2-reductase